LHYPENRKPMSRNYRALATPIILLTALGTATALFVPARLPLALAAAVQIFAFIQFMLLPGLALYLCLQRAGRTAADGALAALAVSPVLLAGTATLCYPAGVSTTVFLALLGASTTVAMLVALRLDAAPATFPPPPEARALLLLIASVVVLVAVLPATREWWRVRSDAWFHGAVVLEMRDIGAPPHDPYFAGMKLQYMWAYHALVLALGRAMNLDYFRVMAALNWHALVLLALAAYRLAAVFRTGTAPRITAVATTLFAFNAAFWFFLPLKAARALIGDIRGWQELSRTFALLPPDIMTSYGFLSIMGAPPFFLDKYMVATAFGMAVSFMLAVLAAGCACMSRAGRGSLLVLCAAIAGTIIFHTYVGLVAVAASMSALAALLVFRGRVRDCPPALPLAPAAVILLAVAVSSPFVYEVTHLKDTGGGSIIGLSLNRIAAIVIPCSLVMLLAWRERAVRTSPAAPARFLQFFALATLLACIVIRLPGANDTAKPPFLVFVSLAVVAGLAVADSCVTPQGRTRPAAALLWIGLFALPCNAIAFFGCWGSHGEPVATREERAIADWAARNTSRLDVFADDPGRVFLLVEGPRRYLFGSWDYASQWKYPRSEMAHRYHAVRSLFSSQPLDSTALSVLTAQERLYVIVRPEHRGAGAAVEERSDLFPVVFESGNIQVREVDRTACGLAIKDAPPGPSEKELIRESGL